MRLALYIVGQERRLVNPPSQVVAGVRTVTTNMNGRDVLPRLSRPFAFLWAFLNFLPTKYANKSREMSYDKTVARFHIAFSICSLKVWANKRNCH
jgi:hypothetical protein